MFYEDNEPRAKVAAAFESGVLRRAADLIEQRWAEVSERGPSLVAPLAAWLRGAADYSEAVPVTPPPEAVNLARAILGSPEERR